MSKVLFDEYDFVKGWLYFEGYLGRTSFVLRGTSNGDLYISSPREGIHVDETKSLILKCPRVEAQVFFQRSKLNKSPRTSKCMQAAAPTLPRIPCRSPDHSGSDEAMSTLTLREDACVVSSTISCEEREVGFWPEADLTTRLVPPETTN